MEEEPDYTYAPQSPDLGVVPEEPHPQHREYRGSVSHFTPFTPTAEVRAESSHPPLGNVVTPSPTGAASHHPYVASSSSQDPPPPPPPPLQQPYYHHAGVSIKHEPSHDEYYAMASSSRAPKKLKKEDGGSSNGSNSAAPGVAEGIEVRTKFPVARIKRIMQADEDVGKVAQVTPVVVSKALELFMISLVSKAAAQARGRGSKRVLAAHLKQAVLEDEQFDFLQEIVNKVPDAPTKGMKEQEDSDEGMDGAVEAPVKKKRARGGGRKKKQDDSDEY